MGAARRTGVGAGLLPAPPTLPQDEAILRVLARFGVARPDQIARQLGAAPPAVERGLRGLGARGLVEPIADGGAVALTAAGMRHLPALLPKQRASARQAEALLLALDIAWLVEAGGTARWMSWAEAVRAGLAIPQATRGVPPAEGLVLPGAGRPGTAAPHPHVVPACVVVRAMARRAIRDRLLAAARATGASEVRLYTEAPLAADLRRQVADLPIPVVVLCGEAAGDPPPPAAEPPAGPSRRTRRAGMTTKRAQVLRLLAAFGYATVDQVARMQGTRSTAASIMLAAMERGGLVARHREHHLHKDVYSATSAGLAAAGSGLPPVPRVPVQRRHSLALLDLADDLCRETSGRWQTQREVQLELQRAQPSPAAAPHGLLTLPDGRRIAVQLELSSQARHVVLSFIAEQLASGRCDELWFVVAPEWERRYVGRLGGLPSVSVRAWTPPDRLGGPRGFRADRVTRTPASPRVLGRGSKAGSPAG